MKPAGFRRNSHEERPCPTFTLAVVTKLMEELLPAPVIPITAMRTSQGSKFGTGDSDPCSHKVDGQLEYDGEGAGNVSASLCQAMSHILASVSAQVPPAKQVYKTYTCQKNKYLWNSMDCNVACTRD